MGGGCVGGARRRGRGVERGLAVFERRGPGGVPERRLPPRVQRGGGLTHGGRLRADRKQEEEGAGVVGERLGGKIKDGKTERRKDGKTDGCEERGPGPRSTVPAFQRSVRSALPHRSA